MKSFDLELLGLSRRRWLVLAASALSGCGGGTDTASVPGTGGTGNLAGTPGTGGTGIFQGAISGFGSVIVNGVTYDNSRAVMRLNGLAVSQDKLRLGMVATVLGDRVAGAVSGSASQIEVWSVAQGPVSEVRSGQFKVAGMTILTTAATWVYGVSAGAAVSNGNYVSVWGLQSDKEGHMWTASCVVVSGTVADAVGSGVVKVEGGQRTLNNVRLTGAVASNLPEKAVVRVQGTWSADASLNVVSTKSIDSVVAMPSQGDVEIEGVVTTVPSGTGFMLGSLTVEATPASYSPAGSVIGLGSRVEVYGAWVGGVLKATKVELEDDQSTGTVEIKAAIQQFTSLADFVMQGQHCNATGATLSSTTTSALLRVGAIFEVKGVKNGDWLQVTEMELDH